MKIGAIAYPAQKPVASSEDFPICRSNRSPANRLPHRVGDLFTVTSPWFLMKALVSRLTFVSAEFTGDNHTQLQALFPSNILLVELFTATRSLTVILSLVIPTGITALTVLPSSIGTPPPTKYFSAQCSKGSLHQAWSSLDSHEEMSKVLSFCFF